MTDQRRIAELEAEVSRRRARAAELRREFEAAADATRSAGIINGDNLVALSGAVRAAELAVEGAERNLERARQPHRPSSFSTHRLDLEREIERIERARAHRHREHDLAVERERGQFGNAPAEHVRAHLANIFGPSERQRREADARDELALADLREQLTAIERRDSSPQPPRAA